MAKQRAFDPPVGTTLVRDNGIEKGVFTTLDFVTEDGSEATSGGDGPVSQSIKIHVGKGKAPPPPPSFDLTVEQDGVAVADHVDTLDFVGTTVESPALGIVRVTPATVFDPTAGRSNITTSRNQASPIDNTKTGVTNLGSSSDGTGGTLADYATILGGDRCVASGIYATAGGLMTVVTAPFAWAYGNNASATGIGSYAFGSSANATGQGAIAFGPGCLSWGQGSFVAGNANVARSAALSAVALGGGVDVWDQYGVGIGFQVINYGQFGVAVGAATEAWGPSVFTCNEDTQGYGLRSFAAGEYSQAAGSAAMAVNRSCSAPGDGAFACGGQAIASRENQWSLAGGNFSDYGGGTAAASAQTSKIVMRSRTPGTAPGEIAVFKTGSDGGQFFACQNNRSYSIRLVATITGVESSGPSDVIATIIRRLSVRMRGGTATVVSNDLEYQGGDPVTATWTLDVASPLNPGGISYSVTGTTAKTMAALSVTFDEVTFPIDSPLDVSDCTLWLDASALPAGTLATWTDESGNGTDFAQASGPNQPNVVLASQNGLPGVEFDGISQWLDTSGASKTLADIIAASGGEYTAFLVIKFGAITAVGVNFPTLPAALSDTEGVWGTSINTSNVYAWQKGGSPTAFGPFGFSQGATAPDATKIYTSFEFLFGVPSLSATSLVRMETNQGNNRAGPSTPIADFAGTLQLGRNFDGTAYAPVTVYEVAIYRRNLSQGEREQVYQYLFDKWAP